MEILGYSMLLVPFIVLFFYIWDDLGFKSAAIIFLITSLMLTCIACGAHLIGMQQPPCA